MSEPVESVVNVIRVDRLLEYIDLEYDPWGVGFKIDMLSRIKGTNDNQFTKAKDGRKWTTLRHARRIKSIMGNPEWMEDPIEIDNDCSNGAINPIPIILDGFHRLYANVASKSETIRIHYAGRVDLLRYLEGVSDKKPPY